MIAKVFLTAVCWPWVYAITYIPFLLIGGPLVGEDSAYWPATLVVVGVATLIGTWRKVGSKLAERRAEK